MSAIRNMYDKEVFRAVLFYEYKWNEAFIYPVNFVTEK